ncbi:hypothetical protein OCS_06454 [Ophiocordyceps sinensis CO18]|uniref:Uncharacterized protein n=1 Tax=Ophiocordyceps sinensis (strain Co18 / CGMCC 3.14243) TaxID=911162 RepID=T5A5G3_OPHSC|nr:hypothetical protein OCS_06454 [Ophiocordyceps sinensis CO18]
MSTSSSPPSSLTGFLEQTASLLTSAASYMRLPALASTGIAAALTSLLYFKQKLVCPILHLLSSSTTQSITSPSPPLLLASYPRGPM